MAPTLMYIFVFLVFTPYPSPLAFRNLVVYSQKNVGTETQHILKNRATERQANTKHL